MAKQTFSEAISFGRVAEQYQTLRAANPRSQAMTIQRFIRDDHGRSFEEFECEIERGPRGHTLAARTAAMTSPTAGKGASTAATAARTVMREAR
jgi:hypothetical protein